MSIILVADDASFIRVLIRQILTRRGYTDIVEAENGLIAVELYKKNRPELSLLDIIMPEMDGLTALAEIMAYDEKAKVIICSALAQENMVQQALKAGALDFVIKPFRPEELLRVVIKYLP
ncbi:MAG: response regulator [Desulfitobacteriaceae bacterium]